MVTRTPTLGRHRPKTISLWRRIMQRLVPPALPRAITQRGNRSEEEHTRGHAQPDDKGEVSLQSVAKRRVFGRPWRVTAHLEEV